MRDLKCVFVSHIHGDHHIGLAKILAMRKRVRPLSHFLCYVLCADGIVWKLHPPPENPLYVVGIRAVHVYLRELSDLEDLGVDADNGVVSILADSLHVRGPWYGKDISRDAEVEPWMNHDRSILCLFLVFMYTDTILIQVKRVSEGHVRRVGASRVRDS